jgi:hypothetical protein
MTDLEWDDLVTAIRDINNIDLAVAACGRLQSMATADDVPRLVSLLSDASFFVREAAAWPLSDLGRTDVLPELLFAYQRGLDEGHDNDGFSAALVDLVEAHPSEATPTLRIIVEGCGNGPGETAKWLLNFCSVSGDA